jgi:hypothetical protein
MGIETLNTEWVNSVSLPNPPDISVSTLPRRTKLIFFPHLAMATNGEWAHSKQARVTLKATQPAGATRLASELLLFAGVHFRPCRRLGLEKSWIADIETP